MKIISLVVLLHLMFLGADAQSGGSVPRSGSSVPRSGAAGSQTGAAGAAVSQSGTAVLQPGGLTLAAFRSLRSSTSLGAFFYLADPGTEGIFVRDAADRTTPDDSVMALRSADGTLFRRLADQGLLNVHWFGAMGNGAADDAFAIQRGIDYILNHPQSGRTLYFPPGSYKLSRPLLIARPDGNRYRQSSINLVGPAGSRDLGMGTATLSPAFNNTFAIGIQSGKGVLIKDLVFRGRFDFPNKLKQVQVDTLSFDEWRDGTTRDNRLSPYSGIVIDPFSDPAAYPSKADMYPGLQGYYLSGLGRAGSTDVRIEGCSIVNFIVGVMITPSNQQNGELVDVVGCDISSNKVAYAMGQAQSKECHVEKLKCWGATHTLFDNVHYGFRHGDGAAVPYVDGVNIADAAKELCCILANSFGGVFRNVYAEGLFRIGYCGGPATVAFEDCSLNFATEGANIPYPDFFVLGSGASFRNCMLRCYTGAPGVRLFLPSTSNVYEGGAMNEPPVAVNLDKSGINPSPSFKNVVMFYSDGILGGGNPNKVSLTSPYPFRGSNGKGADPVYPGNTYFFWDDATGIDAVYKLTYNDDYERTARLHGEATLHVDKTHWTGWFVLPAAPDAHVLRPGDFILTDHLPYQDLFMKSVAPTNPVGIVESIGHDTVRLRQLAYGMQEGMKLELWLDYYVNNSAPFTGDLAVGSTILQHVQGTLPGVGERPDAPMFPTGTFVTAVDAAAKTVTFSMANSTGTTFRDYTFINGYPAIDIYSGFDPATLQQNGRTLIGGATFHRSRVHNLNTHWTDYLLGGDAEGMERIINTNIKGDTTLHPLKFVSLQQGK